MRVFHAHAAIVAIAVRGVVAIIQALQVIAR